MTIASPVVNATTTSNTTTNTTTTNTTKTTEKDMTEAGEGIITPPLLIIDEAKANDPCRASRRMFPYFCGMYVFFRLF